MVRTFADEVVAPQAYEADRTKTLSMEVVRGMGELGLFGLPFPEEAGGQGGMFTGAAAIAPGEHAHVHNIISLSLVGGKS